MNKCKYCSLNSYNNLKGYVQPLQPIVSLISTYSSLGFSIQPVKYWQKIVQIIVKMPNFDACTTVLQLKLIVTFLLLDNGLDM